MFIEQLNPKIKWLKSLHKELIMNKFTNKTTVALVAFLTISLVAGNILFAGGGGNVSGGLVAGDDVAFVSNGFTSGSGSSGNRVSNSSSDLISAEDIGFAAAPYNGSLVATGSSGSDSGQGLVNAADVNFARNGNDGLDTANLVCVVDGIQASGKVCVN